MKLVFWQSPNKPSLQRIYLNGVKNAGSIQIWGQRQGKSNDWALGSTVPVSNDQLDTIRSLVLEHLINSGIPESDAGLFDSLVAAAKQPQKKMVRTKETFSVPVQSDMGSQIPDLSTIMIPEPVDIKIDHREPAELFELLSGIKNVSVTRCTLDLGDVLLNDNIVVERKCCNYTQGGTDFENSILDEDKRLFYQAEKLSQEDKLAIIILEGDVYGNAKRMLINQIDGAISCLCVIQSLSVLTTHNLKHTAYMLLKLATHHKSGLGYQLALRPKKPKPLLDQSRFILEGFPGVSAELATRMLEKFGSLRAIFNCESEDQLMGVKGLGPKTAKKIMMLINGAVQQDS